MTKENIDIFKALFNSLSEESLFILSELIEEELVARNEQFEEIKAVMKGL